MPKIPTLLEMLNAGVHFGHQANRWHPKMQAFIFTTRSGVHVLDLEKTQRNLAEAAEFVKSVATKGGKVLFLGTKKQAQEPMKEAAEKCGMPYITERWLGGFITNFGEVSKLLDKFRDMKKKRESGELEKYTKKERVMFDKEIEKLESYLSGVEKMEKRPEAIFVMDIRNEKTAREEAKKVGMPIIAVCDTNTNPDKIDYVVPANDDAIGSITLVANVIAEAVEEGCKAMPAPAPKVEQKTDKPKRAALKIGGSD